MNYPPDTPDTSHVGPNAKDLVAEIQRLLEASGNPAHCPVYAAPSSHHGVDVWLSASPTLRMNVFLPTR